MVTISRISNTIVKPKHNFKCYMHNNILYVESIDYCEALYFTPSWYTELKLKFPRSFNLHDYRASCINKEAIHRYDLANSAKMQEITPTTEQIKIITAVFEARGQF